MGVTYKLRDEVVQFIISQRQDNPLSSCRQLAQAASLEFGLHLSKSSVHDVLKESGIITPLGRKPRPKFSIPQEKKKQIQTSLSQVNLLLEPPDFQPERQLSVVLPNPTVIVPKPSVILSEAAESPPLRSGGATSPSAPRKDEPKQDMEISPEHEGAGRIFLKAALWDLGVFSEGEIKETDWNYFLTYSKGIKVALENNKSFFIDLPLPIERCIREAADGLINNVKPLIVRKVSDDVLFKACMDSQEGFKINNISIVDGKDHILLELNNLVEYKRTFIVKNRIFMENRYKNVLERAKAIFFLQPVDNNSVIENVLNLKGFDATNKNENIVTLLIDEGYENKTMLQEAAERLNRMYLCDEQDRLVKVVILCERSERSPALAGQGS